jgi:hypothetical protein
MDETAPDRLYGLPLDEFVRERDVLARRLRKEGDREGAEVVKGLSKPSVAAWTVNQLARRRSGDVERLLAAAERLREAQTGGRGDFAEAAAAERDAVRALTRGAADVLAEAGRPANEATLDRVERTLHAAVADDAARRELERGTLTRELEPAGFGSLLGAMPERAPAAKPPSRPRRRDTAKAREALERARERAAARAEEAEAAERALAHARRELERAESDVERARAAAEAAADEVKRAERRLPDA